jgi:hypothetical protein
VDAALLGTWRRILDGPLGPTVLDLTFYENGRAEHLIGNERLVEGVIYQGSYAVNGRNIDITFPTDRLWHYWGRYTIGRDNRGNDALTLLCRDGDHVYHRFSEI